METAAVIAIAIFAFAAGAVADHFFFKRDNYDMVLNDIARARNDLAKVRDDIASLESRLLNKLSAAARGA